MSSAFQSDSIAELAKSLAKAQPHIKEPAKDKKGNFGPYASLASLRRAVLPALNAEGIAVTQLLWSDVDEYLETKLVHISGEWMSSRMKLKIDKPSMQGYGSAITYACRYSLQALAGSGGEEDDDGEASERFPQTIKTQSLAKDYDPSFVVHFGFNKGKHIHDLQKSEIVNTLHWMEQNKKTGGLYDALRKNAEAYLASPQNPKEIPDVDNSTADPLKNLSQATDASIRTSRGPIKRGSGNSFLSKQTPLIKQDEPPLPSEEELSSSYDMTAGDLDYDWEKKK